MKEKSIIFVIGFSILTISLLIFVAILTIKIDPFFHYHKPQTDKYFYVLNNARSQNNGIIKHFDYQGLIIGTSMVANFKTTEAEKLWGCQFIKVPFFGGSFKEVNDNLIVALKHNRNLHIVIRGLDINMFADNKDRMRVDLGSYPTYLYNNNIFDDVNYLFNRDVIFSRIYLMIMDNKKPDSLRGITSFDKYLNWMKSYKFGKNQLYPKGITLKSADTPCNLSETLKNTVLDNIHQNITSLADTYPNVVFYYFFTPFSAQRWQDWLENGTINRQIQIERVVIEEILKCKNIKLFSFNNLFNLTTDLNNYKDATHYGEWINSLILKDMFNETCLLTKENYEAYLDEVLRFYTSFDYTKMNDQEDYEDDYMAAYNLLIH